MKIAITVYPDDTYQASIIIEALKGVRGLELDSFSKGGIKDEFLQKPKTVASQEDDEPVIVHVKQGADGALHVPDRPNINPGEPSIGKIGGDNKAHCIDSLRIGNQPSSKYTEHLKLLWKRGELKFDGKEYYL